MNAVGNGIGRAASPESNECNQSAPPFHQAVHAHAEKLLGYVRTKMPKKLQSEIDAQDVVNDTFLDAFRRASEFSWQSEESTFNWLCIIARHRLLELIRRKGTLKRGGDPEAQRTLHMIQEYGVYWRTPSQSAMSHEIAAGIQQSLERIKPGFRTVLQLHYVEGLTLKQSAERMGRTEGSVRMLCNRALQSLRQDLRMNRLIA